MKLLSALFGKNSKAGAKTRSMEPRPIRPDTPIYAIGDIHGCDALLATLLEQIEQDRAAQNIDRAYLLFVGDLIDRGEQSAQVLERVRACQQADPEHVICLMGNHDKMMLDFLDDPIGKGKRWVRYGGLQALASFGVTHQIRDDDLTLYELSAKLSDAMPDGLEDWIRALPTHWQNGNVLAVHAGLDPELPPQDQSDRTFIWGHPEFMETPRADDLVVVHGHTIVDEASQEHSRIALDTGAYASGRLTAARLLPDGSCVFICAEKL